MILILATIIFLFALFVLSKEDFVFQRKNVSLTTIFNTAFFVILSGLFFSRLVFALTHLPSKFLNPLVFFVIPYFPGLSASGFFIGGSLMLYLLSMRQKLPLGKMFDVFSLALLPAASLVLLTEGVGYFSRKNILFALIAFCLSLVLFLACFILQKMSTKFSWSDGSASLLALLLGSFAFFVLSMFTKTFTVLSAELPYFIFFFFLLFVSFLIKTFKKAQQSV